MANLNNTKDRSVDEKFDMYRKPYKQKWYLKIVAWIICFPTYVFRKHKITKVNIRGLKPPYVILCNHNAFLDFKIATKAIFPHSSNNVVAIDGFIKRENLLRKVGCICKRKFTDDRILVRHLLYVIKQLQQILIIYPEARFSLVGTTAVLPNSLGKLMKLLKVPVVVLNMKGHFIDSPVWNLRHRKNRVEATMTQIINSDEIKTLSSEEINHRIKQAFVYDDYKWQYDNKIKITYPKRCEGLHKVLYKCPKCLQESQMDTKDNTLFCKACGKVYFMDEYGKLHAQVGSTEFSHIPDWYEWEREEVKKEILAGNYHIEDDVDVDSLPNSKGFINIGDGHVVHDINGFKLTYNIDGKNHSLYKNVSSMYSCHIEYQYNNKGDCVDLSTLEDTYYLYFKNLKNIVTKIHFATEELYKLNEK